ncbi:DUF4148 domain-containing protein [Paraburkholderia heleia]|uniref:DUF4148 domain-containing protein n=1 Tax=Paraburkholderia heleia TaxID=634127 RepID=UPI002AB70688|nr:DUF4148 domain-containing protein [Paraburkholderia heleia]
MKSFFKVALISGVLSIPVFAFGKTPSAQADGAPIARGEVRADLVRLQQAGYRPLRNQYPADIQAAEAKVPVSNDSGGVATGTSVSGAPDEASVGSTAEQMLYRHH